MVFQHGRNRGWCRHVLGGDDHPNSWVQAIHRGSHPHDHWSSGADRLGDRLCDVPPFDR
jgi:hypothetical protein